ncbi:MAG TPA: hypothetical protein PLN07_09105, partial [Myxococcota bacterium]|nr:hypothetical protein [Myxococcota bacterium]
MIQVLVGWCLLLILALAPHRPRGEPVRSTWIYCFFISVKIVVGSFWSTMLVFAKLEAAYAYFKTQE